LVAAAPRGARGLRAHAAVLRPGRAARRRDGLVPGPSRDPGHDRPRRRPALAPRPRRQGRLVLPGQGGPARRSLLRLSALANRRDERTRLRAAPAARGRLRPAVAAARALEPARPLRPRLLRDRAAAGARLPRHLLHALLARGGPLAVPLARGPRGARR